MNANALNQTDNPIPAVEAPHGPSEKPDSYKIAEFLDREIRSMPKYQAQIARDICMHIKQGRDEEIVKLLYALYGFNLPEDLARCLPQHLKIDSKIPNIESGFWIDDEMASSLKSISVADLFSGTFWNSDFGKVRVGIYRPLRRVSTEEVLNHFVEQAAWPAYYGHMIAFANRISLNYRHYNIVALGGPIHLEEMLVYYRLKNFNFHRNVRIETAMPDVEDGLWDELDGFMWIDA
jgi:hypothetical protein